MNEQDLEKRLRDVVEGAQPEAPQSLRLFLRDLPEAQPARRRLLGGVRGVFPQIPGILDSHPSARRAQVFAGVAMAIVIGIAGGGLLWQLRQGQNGSAGTGGPTGTPRTTPRTSQGTHRPPVQASLGVLGLECRGVLLLENEDMALPTSAVVTGADTYLGVTDGTLGMSGLVRSDDGLYWTWTSPTTLDPHATVVTSIAADAGGTVVISGGVQGVDGTTDGRIWVSSDDGATWRETSDESMFGGITMRAVAYSAGQFIALGWANSTPAEAMRQVPAWGSTDGVHWSHVYVPIKGTSALILETAAGFVLSGTPSSTDSINQPPMWWSSDGQTWTRATVSDNTAQLMGPLTSATVTASSFVYAVSASSDGMNNMMVASGDGGMTWWVEKPNADVMPYASTVTYVASLSGSSTELLFATTTGNKPAIYMSADDGATWNKISDPSVGGPTATRFLELGRGYQAQRVGRKILAYGEPGTGLGVWLIGMTSYG